MKKGCIFFFLLFIAACFIEWHGLRRYSPEVPEGLAIVMGLLIVATIANLYGIFSALKQRRLLARDPSEWREGELIGVSGRLNATRSPLTAPGSGKRVTLYEYEVKRTHVSGSGKNRSKTTLTDYMGFGMAPCAVHTARGGLKLVGFPMLTNFDRKHLEGPDLDRMYHYLGSATFTARAKGLRGALTQINEVLKDQDGDVRLDLRDPSATTQPPARVAQGDGTGSLVTTPPTPSGATHADSEEDDEDFVRDALSTPSQWFANAKYSVEEHSVENSTHVTAFGTYHTNPQRLDVGGIFQNMSHALFPGEGAAVVSRNLRRSIITFIIFGAITGAAHYYLYPNPAAMGF